MMPKPLMKVAAAEVKEVEDEKKDLDKKQDAALDAISELSKYFDKMKSMNLTPSAVSSSKQAITFISGIKPYMDAIGVTLAGESNEEKIITLNEYLGIKTEGKTPGYLTPQTLESLEAKMIELTNAKEADVNTKYASVTVPAAAPALAPAELGVTAKAWLDKISKAMEQCVTYSLPAENTIALADYRKKLEGGTELTKQEQKKLTDLLASIDAKAKAEEKKLAEAPAVAAPEKLVAAKIEKTELLNKLEKYSKICDENDLGAYKTKLDGYKQMLEANLLLEKDVDALKKLFAEIDQGVQGKVAAEVKAKPALSDKEKLEAYKYLSGLITNKGVFETPMKIGAKVKGLPEGVSKEEAKAFKSAYNKIKKGKALTAEEEGVFFAVAMKKMKEGSAMLAGTNKEQYAAIMQKASATNDLLLAKSGAELLDTSATYFIAYSNQWINKQVKKINDYRKKNGLKAEGEKKVKPLKVPKEYNLKTSAGIIDAIIWITEKENETVSMMITKNAAKASLSPEAEAAIAKIEEIRIMRANIHYAVATVTPVSPEEYLEKLKTKKAPTTTDLFDATNYLKKVVALVESSSPDEPVLAEAKTYLSEIKNASNPYTKDPKEIYDVADTLLSIEEYKLWLTLAKETGKSESEIEKSDNYMKWGREVLVKALTVNVPVSATPLLAGKLVQEAVLLLSPTYMKVYENDVFAKKKSEYKNTWVTGIKGAIVYENIADEPIPLYQTEFMRGEIYKSMIHPAYGIIEAASPVFGTKLTDPEVYESVNGPVIGIIEAQKSKMAAEAWNEAKNAVDGAALTYSGQYKDVADPSMSAIDDIADAKEGEIGEILDDYGIGLAPIKGYENSAVVVTTTMLEAFGEKGNMTVTKGEVTAKTGATLKSVDLANLYYSAVLMVDSKEKYDKLSDKDAEAKAQEIYKFLKANVPEDMQTADIKKVIFKLGTATSSLDFVEALDDLRKVPEFGLSKIYKFDSPEAKMRFYWAKEVESSIPEFKSKSLNFRKSQFIAILDTGIEDAKAFEKLVAKGKLEIYIPGEKAEAPEEIVMEPPVLTITDIMDLNNKLGGVVFKGFGEKWLRGPAEVGTLAEEGMSFFGNNEETWTDYVTIVMKDLNYINSNDLTDEETARRASELATFLEENYSEDVRNIQDAIDLLNAGDLVGGLKALRVSGNAGLEAILENLGNLYVVDVDEKGVNVYGAGVSFRFNPGDASQATWKAIKGDKQLSHVLLYEIDMFYRWQMANMPVDFIAAKIDPETLNYYYMDTFAGEGTFTKHTAGLATSFAGNIKGGKKVQKAFGNVWIGTFTIGLSYTMGEMHTKEAVPDYDKDGNPIPGSEKVVSLKGNQLAFSVLDFTMKFPGAAGPVRLENVGVGVTNIPLYKSEEGAVFKWSESFNPLFHAVVTVPVYETKTAEKLPDLFSKNYNQVAIYAAPQFLLYMKDPTIMVDGGVRYIHSGGNWGVLLQVGSSVTYSVKGEATKGEKVKWNAVKGNVALEVYPGVSFDVGGAYSPTDNNWGVSGGITITPKKTIDYKKKKKQEKLEKEKEAAEGTAEIEFKPE